jgi:hypothetical protein
MNTSNSQPEQPNKILPEPQEAEFNQAALDQFAHWFDDELEKLVARWRHLAAPNASRPKFDRSKF